MNNVGKNRRTTRKSTSKEFLYHKAYMARAEIEPGTQSNRGERSTNETPRSPSSQGERQDGI